MNEKVINKGIKFVPAGAVSGVAEAKLKQLAERKKASIEKIISEYKSGKFQVQK
jgi:hypothetical protein